MQVRSALTPRLVHMAVRLRTGSPLRVLNTSPDGMLVESPARLLPGRQLELVLQSGASQEQAPWVVVHSRVGCIRGSSHIRYRAGLRRATGSIYSHRREQEDGRNRLPADVLPSRPFDRANMEEVPLPAAGTRFVRQEGT
jgi:hypothetical protein